MKVLLVVDMQKGFMVSDKYVSLSDKIRNLINKSNYDKVIFTKFVNTKSQNSFYIDKIGWTGLLSIEEQDFSFELPENSVVFEKYGYGLASGAMEYLKSLDIHEIDVCGVKSEACVYAISLQLWDNHIFPNILVNFVEGDIDMQNIYIKQFGKIDNRS